MDNSDWLQIQADVAEVITERECKVNKIKCWERDEDGQILSEEAQDIFNIVDDEVGRVMEDVLGTPPANFTDGFIKIAVTAAGRRDLIKALSKHAKFDVTSIVGKLK